jgi:hypothetical protein
MNPHYYHVLWRYSRLFVTTFLQSSFARLTLSSYVLYPQKIMLLESSILVDYLLFVFLVLFLCFSFSLVSLAFFYLGFIAGLVTKTQYVA